MMNELLTQYNADSRRASDEWQAWLKTDESKNYSNYTGFKVDYVKHEKAIREEIKSHFNLTDAQADYIMGKAYEDYHSGFSDMFWGAYNLAEFVVGYPKN